MGQCCTHDASPKDTQVEMYKDTTADTSQQPPPEPSTLSPQRANQEKRQEASPPTTVASRGRIISGAAGSSIDTTGVSATFLRQFIRLCRSRLSSDFLDTATTHDVCEKLIKPDTHPQGSYVNNYPRLSNAAQREEGDNVAAVSPHTASHLGPATVFVSHAWRYRFIDVAQAMLDYQEDNPDTTCYFWFDLFVNDQNNATNNDFDWWCTTFRSSIESIGKVMLVLSPWNDPVPLTRAWCLWEITCAVDSNGIELAIQLPKSQREPFKKALEKSYKAVTDTLVRVQAERAEASNPADKGMIFKAIKATEGGFNMVNEKVKDQMREWLLQTAVEFVREMEAQGDTESDGYARMCHTIGLVLDDFGQHTKATDYYEKCLKIQLATLGENHPDTAASYTGLGSAHKNKGDYDRAIQYYSKSLQVQLATLGENHPSTAASYMGLGNAYSSKGDYDRAIEYHNKSLQVHLATLGENHPDTAFSYNNLANAYAEKGDYDRAIEYHNRSLQVKLATLGENHPVTVSSYMGLGNAYYAKGDYERAIEYHNRSLQVKLATLGENHPDTAMCYNNLGSAYYSKGDYDRAIEYHNRSLQVKLATLGENHPLTATSYNNLGSAYSDKGDYDRAIEYHSKSLEFHLATLGENNPSTAVSYNNLGSAYYSKGDYDRAMDYYNQGLRITLAMLGENHPSTASSRFNMSLLAEKQGDMATARHYASKAYDIFLAVLGPDHPLTRQAKSRIADVS